MAADEYSDWGIPAEVLSCYLSAVSDHFQEIQERIESILVRLKALSTRRTYEQERMDCF
jgi:hypothetical protein